MEIWLLSLCVILVFIVILLLVKLHLLQKSADEIRAEFADRLITDTNNLISISSRDRHMRRLAADINVQLKKLHDERHRFLQGDLELKDAVANISHDLRTPLTAVCGYLDLLDKEEKSPEVSRYLNIIRERTEALKQLTEEFFRYSVITSASEDLVLEDVVLNRVLEESISAYYAALKGCRITPEISMPEQKVTRRLNRGFLSRILGNIMNNAIKYSDGDLRITLTEQGEMVFSNRASQLNEISVGRLFDRFYTVETGEKSTGLGLSIVRILTEQMGGTIAAHYENGRVEIHLEFPELPKS